MTPYEKLSGKKPNVTEPHIGECVTYHIPKAKQINKLEIPPICDLLRGHHGRWHLLGEVAWSTVLRQICGVAKVLPYVLLFVQQVKEISDGHKRLEGTKATDEVGSANVDMSVDSGSDLTDDSVGNADPDFVPNLRGIDTSGSAETAESAGSSFAVEVSGSTNPLSAQETDVRRPSRSKPPNSADT
ncbi:hypothetical protein PInf_021714 [Phytophthora infestans]|nr:hypothetical protein PInf_021714 [Phytophthora infestans]